MNIHPKIRQKIFIEKSGKKGLTNGKSALIMASFQTENQTHKPMTRRSKQPPLSTESRRVVRAGDKDLPNGPGRAERTALCLVVTTEIPPLPRGGRMIVRRRAGGKDAVNLGGTAEA